MHRRAIMVPYTTPRYVTSVTRRNSSEVISLNGEKTETIALLIQTSIGPNSCSTVAAAFSICSGLATSTCKISARPPRASTSARAPSRPASPRESSATHASCFANSRAVARPTPAEAPVITTVSCPFAIHDGHAIREPLSGVGFSRRLRTQFLAYNQLQARPHFCDSAYLDVDETERQRNFANCVFSDVGWYLRRLLRPGYPYHCRWLQLAATRMQCLRKVGFA